MENHLLAALPPWERKRLLPDLEPVPLIMRDVLYHPDEPIRYVYFPTSGVVSILTVLAAPASIEVGTVGSEGMAGISVFLGVNRSPNRAVVQAPGEALRMKARLFKEAVKRENSLHELLHLYTYTLLTQMSCSIACNRFHGVEKRLSRWLLMMHDRLETNEFQLTQDLMSRMIGAQRPHVTTAVRSLQNSGLISNGRGTITVLNRRGLEKTSCDCYRLVKEKFDGLFRR